MFDSFQNDDGILKQITINQFGQRIVVLSINVKCDVQFRNRVTTNNQGQEVNTRADVFVTPNETLNGLGLNVLSGTFDFDYEGETYQVERLDRVREPAKDVIDHYQLYLR